MVSEKSKCNKQNEAGWDKEGLRDKKGRCSFKCGGQGRPLEEVTFEKRQECSEGASHAKIW